MHIFFSGIGGTGIGPLALIAHQAGYDVSGSDKQDSQYIDYLKKHGIRDIHIGQDAENITQVHTAKPIDWFVYSTAVAIEQPDSPEFVFCRENSIRMTARGELLNVILKQKQLKMIAIAGTHGKTTTSAMLVWLLKQLGKPVSYSFGAKTSFSDMGAFEEGSEYFVYEADEFARNFLEFEPAISLITGIDWDHPDIYPTREDYYAAFRQFLGQSKQSIIWKNDGERLEIEHPAVLTEDDERLREFNLIGEVNRKNALLVCSAVQVFMPDVSFAELVKQMNAFPGLSRRFEQITPGLFSDYAHTPPKIHGAIQAATEAHRGPVVVVYEGLHNTRQHFIKDELKDLFTGVQKLYIVPSYLAREDPSLPLLSPADLRNLLSDDIQAQATPSLLNDELKQNIEKHLAGGDLVLCLSAGGGGSLDEWLRQQFIAA